MKHQINHHSFSGANGEAVVKIAKNCKAGLSTYSDKLLWWNKKINLVSRDVSRETVESHVLHSLVISQSLLFQQAHKIIDTGSGGGLPGIPLAVAFPEKVFLLNDVVRKKMMACKSMANDLSLENIQTEAGSIEAVNVKAEDLIISKHAFKINKLCEYLRGRPWKNVVLLKGKERVEDELEGIEEELQIDIFDLQPAFENDFFEGKAMVEIKKL